MACCRSYELSCKGGPHCSGTAAVCVLPPSFPAASAIFPLPKDSPADIFISKHNTTSQTTAHRTHRQVPPTAEQRVFRDNRMPWLVAFVPLFLMACASEPASALAPGSSRVELFKQKNSTVPFEDNNGTVRERVVHSFRIPTLVNVNGVMVAIADARYETSYD
ncbi:trans-sialidase, partial [Trypanosoma rangeli]